MEQALGLHVEVQVEQDIDVRPGALTEGLELRSKSCDDLLLRIELRKAARTVEAGGPTRRVSVKEEDVRPEASFVDDLGADSLDTVELVMALEEEFETEIPDEDAEKITTVQQAMDYVKQRESESQ